MSPKLNNEHSRKLEMDGDFAVLLICLVMIAAVLIFTFIAVRFDYKQSPEYKRKVLEKSSYEIAKNAIAKMMNQEKTS